MLLTGRAFSPRKVKSRVASRCWLSLYAQLWVENRSGSCRSALRSFGEEMASQALFLLFQAKVQKELSGLGKWAGREWGEEPDNLLYSPEVKAWLESFRSKAASWHKLESPVFGNGRDKRSWALTDFCELRQQDYPERCLWGLG